MYLSPKQTPPTNSNIRDVCKSLIACSLTFRILIACSLTFPIFIVWSLTCIYRKGHIQHFKPKRYHTLAAPVKWIKNKITAIDNDPPIVILLPISLLLICAKQFIVKMHTTILSSLSRYCQNCHYCTPINAYFTFTVNLSKHILLLQ